MYTHIHICMYIYVYVYVYVYVCVMCHVYLYTGPKLPQSAGNCSAPAGVRLPATVMHSMCTMHKLGLQVWPSPDVMVLTLCKMAMLSTALDDTLAYCTVEEFAAGFKTVPGFPDVRHQAQQVLVRRGHLDHRAECWQPLLHIHRDGVAIFV